jgi:FkbM family methyltransferase
MMPLNRVIYDSQVPKGYDFSVVFDIGTNVGQTCTRARESCPDAKIFCFEPFDETFQQLKKATDRLKRSDLIDCHCFAFGDVEGEILVYKKALSSQNSLLPQLNKPKPNEDNTGRVLVRRVFRRNVGFDKNHLHALKCLQAPSNAYPSARRSAGHNTVAREDTGS